MRHTTNKEQLPGTSMQRDRYLEDYVQKGYLLLFRLLFQLFCSSFDSNSLNIGRTDRCRAVEGCQRDSGLAGRIFKNSPLRFFKSGSTNTCSRAMCCRGEMINLHTSPTFPFFCSLLKSNDAVYCQGCCVLQHNDTLYLSWLATLLHETGS
jgi:hypothetical protein